MSHQFTIGDHNYIADKLDAFKALHVARRIAPLVGHLALATQGVLDVKDLIPPLLDGIADIKEADFDYVRDACLSVVKRVEGERAQPVYNSRAKMMQYTDINAKQLLEIIITVVMDNLSDFLGDLPSIGTGGLPDQNTPPST